MAASSAPSSPLRSLLACLAYGGSSLSIILCNKYILTEFGFRNVMFMAFSHMCATLFFLVVLKYFDLIYYQDFSFDNLSKAWPMALTFIANIVVGLVSVKYVSIPMFTTLRRMTALVTMLLDWSRTGERPSMEIVGCVIVMVSGALVAGWGDLSFSLKGYIAVMVNNLLTAGSLVMTKNFTDQYARAVRRTEQYNDGGSQPPQSLNKFGLLFYNALVAIPCLFVLCLVFDEFSAVVAFKGFDSSLFKVLFFASAINAFAINWATMYCTEVNSPLTTSVTGQTKNILVTLTGILFFSDSNPTFLLILGVSISLVGSFAFAYVKFMASRRAKQQRNVEAENLLDKEGDKEGDDLEHLEAQSPLREDSTHRRASSDPDEVEMEKFGSHSDKNGVALSG